MEPLLLGIDIGTTRIKALLLTASGTEAGRSVTTTPFTTSDQRVEMAPAALWTAVADAVAGLPGGLDAVAGVGIAGMAESGAPLDAAGAPVGAVIGWHDPRGQETVDLLSERFGGDLDRRIGQRLRTVSSVAKLGWLVRHEAAPVHRWLGVPELCLQHLTGAEVTECSLAARSGAYDVAERRYLPEVLGAIGVDPAVFPPVEPAGRTMGLVSVAGADWLGLAPDTPVTLAGHDHLAGAEGAGAHVDDLVNSVGTAETVVARHPKLPDLDRALALRAAVTLRPGGDGWAILASAARSGLVLAPAARALGRSLEELDALAEGAHHVDAGELVGSIERGEPPAVPDAPPGEIWNGLLRALAERTWAAVDRLVDLVGPAPRLVVFGGGSASRPWLRAKSQCGPLPVWRSTAPEAVARGAALFAGVAAGWWASPAGAPAPDLARAPA